MSLIVEDESIFIRKDGLLPITCGSLKYFDEKYDKVCINVDSHPVVLSAHLYDFVNSSASNNLSSGDSLLHERQKHMQFSGMVKRESKT